PHFDVWKWPGLHCKPGGAVPQQRSGGDDHDWHCDAGGQLLFREYVCCRDGPVSGGTGWPRYWTDRIRGWVKWASVSAADRLDRGSLLVQTGIPDGCVYALAWRSRLVCIWTQIQNAGTWSPGKRHVNMTDDVKIEQVNVNKKFSRRSALKGIGGALAAATIPSVRADGTSTSAEQHKPWSARTETATIKKHAGKPNILWITGEGVPVSALSCYGSTLIQTPNIDRIANEGVRFRNAFTTNALCGPSRATLLTGTYSHINGTIANPGIQVISGEAEPTFDESQPTVAKLLKQNGYQTGIVGKWHLPANPGNVGFDYFVFKEGAGGPYYEAEGYLGNSKLGSNVIEKQRHEEYETDITTDLAIKGMKEFTQPFLMMVQYFNAHRPFDPPH